ncbi:maleylpyruvate isomerase N-terminal domain-containing protein [Amycolatopsis sp. GM8]|uniref:maleylpyruvate isomerase N-terminal domain-containing protein n=1 Tax=Amycolatopsis sp. GM8 TaxID=2896530 RepID=UPI001F1F5569|nr:maleylpyruvate isomerase N-terminal domain-containing protein [Amycolatopsis sp. GM8]
MAGQALIEPGRFLDALGAEVELLLGAARTASPDITVPSSPLFTVGEVVRHLGGGYRVARLWLTEGHAPQEWQRNPAPRQSTEDYLRTGLVALMREFSVHAPDSYAASWWPADHTYGFWRRRMAHETTIHRYDVQDAVGTYPGEVAEDFAIDGVDEALVVWFGQRLSMIGLSGTARHSVGVSTGGHHWIARAGPGFTEAWRCSAEEAARADGLVTAPPWHLYLWMWGRLPLREVEWSGDEDAIAQMWALMRLATK